MRTAIEREHEEVDSEITLSATTLLGIFFGLVLVCGVFFGFGYSTGRHGSDTANANTPDYHRAVAEHRADCIAHAQTLRNGEPAGSHHEHAEIRLRSRNPWIRTQPPTPHPASHPLPQ